MAIAPRPRDVGRLRLTAEGHYSLYTTRCMRTGNVLILPWESRFMGKKPLVYTGESRQYIDCIPKSEGGWGIEEPATSRPKKKSD